MSNQNPGAAVIVASFCLFGAFTAIAWSQDSRLPVTFPRQDPEHVCNRLQFELDQQGVENLITEDERNAIVFRCWRDFG